jgi:hypothetical protein
MPPVKLPTPDAAALVVRVSQDFDCGGFGAGGFGCKDFCCMGFGCTVFFGKGFCCRVFFGKGFCGGGMFTV